MLSPRANPYSRAGTNVGFITQRLCSVWVRTGFYGRRLRRVEPKEALTGGSPAACAARCAPQARAVARAVWWQGSRRCLRGKGWREAAVEHRGLGSSPDLTLQEAPIVVQARSRRPDQIHGHGLPRRLPAVASRLSWSWSRPSGMLLRDRVGRWRAWLLPTSSPPKRFPAIGVHLTSSSSISASSPLLSSLRPGSACRAMTVSGVARFDGVASASPPGWSTTGSRPGAGTPRVVVLDVMSAWERSRGELAGGPPRRCRAAAAVVRWRSAPLSKP